MGWFGGATSSTATEATATPAKVPDSVDAESIALGPSASQSQIIPNEDDRRSDNSAEAEDVEVLPYPSVFDWVRLAVLTYFLIETKRSS